MAFTSIQEAVDTTSATGELFYNIVASISQWKRRAIGERTRTAMAYQRQRGRGGGVSRWVKDAPRAAERPARRLMRGEEGAA